MTCKSKQKKLKIQKPERQPPEKDRPEIQPDWSTSCDVCGSVPVVPITGLCGPCSYGEADTYGGNW